MARPGSERATGRWLGERSALDELLGVDFQTLEPMPLYRASDALMAHREAIEHHLFDQVMDLFNLHPTLKTVRVLDAGAVLATHPRSFDRGQQIEDPAHIEELEREKRLARATVCCRVWRVTSTAFIER